ncbi:MAG: ABC transporter ATP-binding protein/permease [Actinomycetota bacterium]|nr:ABC transporter ATP-binding protein/permease [Actinomycetota bacterium]
MREWLRTIRLMVTISWRADAPRSVAALVTASGQMAAVPLRALGLKVLADGAVAADGPYAIGGAALVLAFSAVHRVMVHASFNVRMRLRENTQLYLDSHLMGLTSGLPGLEHHERPEYHDQVELLRNERGALANPFNPISWTVASLVQVISVLALLAGVHPALALLPLFGLPSAWLTARSERSHLELVEEQAEDNRRLRHFLELTTEPPAAKEVRIYDLGEELLARRRVLFERLERTRVALAIRRTALASGGWLVFAAGYLAAAAWTVRMAGAGHVTVGDVVLVLTVGSQVNQQMAEMSEHIAWFTRTHRAVQRLSWFTRYAEQAHAAVEPTDPAPVPERLRQGIRFHGVGFTYPGTAQPVLSGVDLFFPAGSTIALVGENGAGKTTLVKLLFRLYEPSEGTISVDGVDLRRIPIGPWRARLSAGFQDFARFQLAARETVGVGDTACMSSDPHVLAALKRAAGSDVLAALPGGLGSQLGKEFAGGVELSIGQWQKLALGRAMMRPEPLVLVLDEPTASLDATTEHALFEHFHGAAREAARRSGAITILISHRFSTVRMADQILVVAAGRVVEMGTHLELLAAGGLYAELYGLQAQSYR